MMALHQHLVSFQKLCKIPEGKDFRTANGDLTKVDTKSAQELWKKAKQELGSEKITLELLTSDADLDKKTGEFLKGQLEKNLDGLTVNIKPQPRKQQVSLLLKGDYEIGIDGWSPDFADQLHSLSYLQRITLIT